MHRLRPLTRAWLASAAGAVSAVLMLIAAYSAHPTFTLGIDGALPSFASGFYEGERDGDRTYAWSRRRALIVLQGLDRSAPWTCDTRLRGAHPDTGPQPVVSFEVDGAPLVQRTLTNDFEHVQVIVPPRASPGLQLAIISTPTFTPSGADTRELGSQIETVTCSPTHGGVVLPPRRAMINAAVAAGIFGAAFGLTAMATGPAVASAIFVAGMQAFPISLAAGPYASGFQNGIVWFALWTALALLVAARGLEWVAGIIRGAALFALACTAVVLYAKLLAITHPSKPVVDAVFHAHRLEYVMAGHYFFTQPIRSGVQFPYAIALYVFAWPWSVFTRDHVTLLRVVVLATEALAGCALYRMVVKGWGDRLAGAMAVPLFSAVPLPYVVIGNANLTNAFGQAAALIALAAATTWTFDRRVIGIGVLTLLVALALLAHVSTLMLLLTTLALLVVFYWFSGERGLRRSAACIAVATVLAVASAVGLYYGHFGDAYRTLGAVRTGSASAPTAAQDLTQIAPVPMTPPAAPVSIPARVVQAVSLTTGAIGWPLILLSLVGIWRMRVIGVRNRVGLAIAALGATYVLFVAGTVLSPVDPAYVRYADEFIARTVYATYPGVVLLAAIGSAWMFNARGLVRALGTSLLAWAAFDGVTRWVGWLQ